MSIDRRRRTVITTFALGGAAGLGLPLRASAQAAWPMKAVKIVVPYAAGGPADVVARELAQKLAADTGQTFLIDNQGGGLGLPALNTVARAEPDGHLRVVVKTTDLGGGQTRYEYAVVNHDFDRQVGSFFVRTQGITVTDLEGLQRQVE